MIKHDDYFSLVKNNTLMFAKAESSSNSNFLDSENNYKIFVVCKIELLGAEYRLTVNFLTIKTIQKTL